MEWPFHIARPVLLHRCLLIDVMRLLCLTSLFAYAALALAEYTNTSVTNGVQVLDSSSDYPGELAGEYYAAENALVWILEIPGSLGPWSDVSVEFSNADGTPDFAYVEVLATTNTSASNLNPDLYSVDFGDNNQTASFDTSLSIDLGETLYVGVEARVLDDSTLSWTTDATIVITATTGKKMRYKRSDSGSWTVDYTIYRPSSSSSSSSSTATPEIELILAEEDLPTLQWNVTITGMSPYTGVSVTFSEDDPDYDFIFTYGDSEYFAIDGGLYSPGLEWHISSDNRSVTANSSELGIDCSECTMIIWAVGEVTSGDTWVMDAHVEVTGADEAVTTTDLSATATGTLPSSTSSSSTTVTPEIELILAEEDLPTLQWNVTITGMSPYTGVSVTFSEDDPDYDFIFTYGDSEYFAIDGSPYSPGLEWYLSSDNRSLTANSSELGVDCSECTMIIWAGGEVISGDIWVMDAHVEVTGADEVVTTTDLSATATGTLPSSSVSSSESSVMTSPTQFPGVFKGSDLGNNELVWALYIPGSMGPWSSVSAQFSNIDESADFSYLDALLLNDSSEVADTQYSVQYGSGDQSVTVETSMNVEADGFIVISAAALASSGSSWTSEVLIEIIAVTGEKMRFKRAESGTWTLDYTIYASADYSSSSSSSSSSSTASATETSSSTASSSTEPSVTLSSSSTSSAETTEISTSVESESESSGISASPEPSTFSYTVSSTSSEESSSAISSGLSVSSLSSELSELSYSSELSPSTPSTDVYTNTSLASSSLSVESTDTTGSTEVSSTLITTTSCSGGACSEVTETTGLTIVTTTSNGVVTEYTTYCPLNSSTTEGTGPSTTVITTTSCSNNSCFETTVVTGLTVEESTNAAGVVTEYTTYCPLTTEGATGTGIITVTVCSSGTCSEAETTSTGTLVETNSVGPDTVHPTEAALTVSTAATTKSSGTDTGKGPKTSTGVSATGGSNSSGGSLAAATGTGAAPEAGSSATTASTEAVITTFAGSAGSVGISIGALIVGAALVF